MNLRSGVTTAKPPLLTYSNAPVAFAKGGVEVSNSQPRWRRPPLSLIFRQNEVGEPLKSQNSRRPRRCSLPLRQSKLSNFISAIALRSSRDTPAPPSENQGNYEQHKEYEEQNFRNACRRCGDAAKSKHGCDKRND
jgi:hypothetical protein